MKGLLRSECYKNSIDHDFAVNIKRNSLILDQKIIRISKPQGIVRLPQGKLSTTHITKALSKVFQR
ncbi:MAG: hypothetical protein ACJAUP_001474 [Cellvibrionaceae bacterium]|jgi:hypothetical protein